MKKLLLTFLILANIACAAQTNYALNLNGTNQYVTIGAPLSSNTSYTKEAWVYATTSSGSRNIISSQNTPFWINNGTLSAGQAGSYSLVTETSFPINRWVHVAVTYDAATTTMRLYRDGILVSTNTSVSAYTSENNFIGSHQGSSSFFQGSIDEVRIWNTALSQAQLKQNMYKGPANNASGLVAYYKCNDGSGTTLTNATGGTDGSIQNSATWEASPVQFAANALSFDGTDDVVSVADHSSLDITTAITLEAWVYATKNSGIQNVVCKSSNTANNGYIFPRTDNGWSNVVVYLHIGGAWRTLSATYPSLNAWHHLAATYDGATMKIYIDGAEAASQARTGSISTNSNVLALGNQTGFSEYFGGYADEIRIWNVARTQTEIQNNMDTELDPTTQTGLVSYYTFNHGAAAGTNTGLTALIDMQNTNNGTLSNFALSGSTSNLVTQNSSISVLPLVWKGFTAKRHGESVALNWSALSEHNTKEFVVEHSHDGIVWDNISVVAAAGNSTMVRKYRYLHLNPVDGINYYRIRQIDIDGRYSYSMVRPVRFTGNQHAFIVLNNPVSNGMLMVKLNRPAHLVVYNQQGMIVWQKDVFAGTEQIDVGKFAKGAYFLHGDGGVKKIIVE